jgi:hypothetical protein
MRAQRICFKTLLRLVVVCVWIVAGEGCSRKLPQPQDLDIDLSRKPRPPAGGVAVVNKEAEATEGRESESQGETATGEAGGSEGRDRKGGNGKGGNEGRAGAAKAEDVAGVGGAGVATTDPADSGGGAGKTSGDADSKAKSGEGTAKEGRGAGRSSSPNEPALPGRDPPPPRYTREQSMAVAESALKKATDAQRQNDLEQAYTRATEAYESVAAHADSCEDCRKLMGRAGRMLEKLAELQGRRGPPDAVPTLFE